MKGPKVLFVEDTDVFAAHLQKSLEKLGYDNAWATSGNEALEKASQMHPDLVLMDISLNGGMDGIEAAQKIMDDFNIPVIYLTGSTDKETLERAAISGPFAYIVKPFNINTLFTNIEMALYKHHMECKLKKSEERYCSFVQHFRGIAYQRGIDFKPLFIHGAVEAITGYTEKELIIEKPGWDQIIHPDDLPNIYDKDKISSISDYTNEYEYRILCKNGQIRYVHEIIQKICDHFGKPNMIQGIIFDITKSKLTKKENERLKQEMEFILGAAKTGLDIIDAQFNLRFIDPEQKKIYGHSAGKKCYEYFMDRRQPCPDCEVRRVMETKALVVGEKVLVKEGSRSIQVTTMPFENDEGELLFAQVKVDISERKQAEENLQNTLVKLRKSLGGVIEAMALTVESKDPYTAGHQRRVADLARAIANEIRLSKEKIDGLRMAGIIHDLGKISIPAEILSKPGRITDIEFSLIKTHPQIGYDILKTIEFPWPIAQIVYQHHERMDGSGYPLGLSGQNILPEARILAVADVVEAMSSHRPYRSALGIEKALEEISRGKNTVYDPEAVDACLKLFQEKGFKFKYKSTSDQNNAPKRTDPIPSPNLYKSC